MTGSSYQCQNCHYAIHPRCYNRVITKCITEDEYKLKSPNVDLNTGQLLKYNIPHRIEFSINLGANWCHHCGYILPIGKRVAKCNECGKCAHKDCFPMIPNFCGLHPDVADKLVAAFEENEKRMHLKELEDAELEAIKNKDSIAAAEQLLLAGLPLTGSVPSDSPITNNQSRPSITAITEKSISEYAASNLEKSLISESVPIPPVRSASKINALRTPSPLKSTAIPSSVSPQIFSNVPSSSTLTDSIGAPHDTPVSLGDFHFISVIGRGAFGKVLLATEKKTNRLYAIKALKKEFIIQSEDVKRYLKLT